MEIDDSVHFVLGGDWNLIFDKALDFMGGSPSLKYSFTWHGSNPPKMSRIDFFLISNEMQYNVKFCKHLPSFLSDHSPVFFISFLTS